MWKNILFFQISNFNLNGPLSFGLLFPEFLSCQSEKKKDFSRQLETDAIWLCTKVVSIVYERRKVHDRDIGWHYLGLGVLFKVGCVWLRLWRGSMVAWHFDWSCGAKWPSKCQMTLRASYRLNQMQPKYQPNVFLMDWAQMVDIDFGLIHQNISIKRASFQYQGCPLS